MFRKDFENVDHNQHDDVLLDSMFHIDAERKDADQKGLTIERNINLNLLS